MEPAPHALWVCLHVCNICICICCNKTNNMHMCAGRCMQWHMTSRLACVLHRPAAGLHSATSAAQRHICGKHAKLQTSAGGTKATLLMTVPTSNNELSMRATAGMACNGLHARTL